LASEEELKAGLDWYSELSQDDKAKFVNEREALRKQVGQTSAVTSIK
jgi:hypothetical protein